MLGGSQLSKFKCPIEQQMYQTANIWESEITGTGRKKYFLINSPSFTGT